MAPVNNINLSEEPAGRGAARISAQTHVRRAGRRSLVPSIIVGRTHCHWEAASDFHSSLSSFSSSFFSKDASSKLRGWSSEPSGTRAHSAHVLGNEVNQKVREPSGKAAWRRRRITEAGLGQWELV